MAKRDKFFVPLTTNAKERLGLALSREYSKEELLAKEIANDVGRVFKLELKITQQRHPDPAEIGLLGDTLVTLEKNISSLAGQVRTGNGKFLTWQTKKAIEAREQALEQRSGKAVV